MTLRREKYTAHLDKLGANWTDWREAQVVADFGDPDTEYNGVVEDGAGLIDFAARDTAVITGPDTVPWLQGLVTNDLMDLQEEGSGQQTTAVNSKGRLVAEMRLLHMPEMFVADLEHGNLHGGFLSHLRQHIITEDVQVHDRSESTAKVGLFGTEAADILDNMGEFDRSADVLEVHEGTWGLLGNREVVIQRVDWLAEPGFVVSGDRSQQLNIWMTLSEAAEPIGHDTFETLRIEAGVPRFGVELTEKIIPLEAELDHTIAYDKGCYLGQEIIARLDTLGTPAKRLRTLVFEGGAAPAEGADVECEGRNAGFVASSAWSPRLGAPIALAYVKRKFNDIGNTVEVEGRETTIRPLGFAISSAP